MFSLYRMGGSVARCYTRRVDYLELAREHASVNSYRRGLFGQRARERWPDIMRQAAQEAENTGKPLVDCLPDLYMLVGHRQDEIDPVAIEMLGEMSTGGPKAFPFEMLLNSRVPGGHERVREWLSLSGTSLSDEHVYMTFDWSTALSTSLVGHEGLPIEALVELGEKLLGPEGYPVFPAGETLVGLYARLCRGRTEEQVAEAVLVASVMPHASLRAGEIDKTRYPVVHDAVYMGVRRRVRDRLPLMGVHAFADEMEELLQGYTPSGSWQGFEFLAHILDDPWKLLGKLRKGIRPETRLLLENSSGRSDGRYGAALRNRADPNIPVWTEWLSELSPDEPVWFLAPTDRDLTVSALRSLLSPLGAARGPRSAPEWTNRETSCIQSLTADDINEMIRRGYTAQDAFDLLSTLRTGDAFRMHFYEGMPVEYAVAMVDWPDV